MTIQTPGEIEIQSPGFAEGEWGMTRAIIPPMPKSNSFDDVSAWRREMRTKHRVMTAGEYLAWSRGGGDAVSFSGASGALSGGVTILWNTPAMIGKILP